MSAEKGLLVVVSGPAGSGKGTVLPKVIAAGNFRFSVSATTRAPRPGEKEGVNYHYLTRDAFEARIAAGEMLEYTTYCNNYYGTPKKEAEAVLETGCNLLLEIEVEGAANVKKAYPDAVLIMLLPPSYAVEEARLRGRGTESEEALVRRLEQARYEVKQAPHYDYIVYNRDGEADRAAEDILAIVRAERLRTARNPDAVDNYFV